MALLRLGAHVPLYGVDLTKMQTINLGTSKYLVNQLCIIHVSVAILQSFNQGCLRLESAHEIARRPISAFAIVSLAQHVVQMT